MSKASRRGAKQNRSTNQQRSGSIPVQSQSMNNGTAKAAVKDNTSIDVQADKQTTTKTPKQAQPASKQEASSLAKSHSTLQTKTGTRGTIKHERRIEEQRRREEERRRASQRAAQRRRITIGSIVAAAVLVAGVVAYFIYTGTTHANNSSKPAATSTSVTSDNPNFPAVDGVPCDVGEQTTVHYHAHLSIYINGVHVHVPAQVGIAPDGSCYYWLHTHATDGVIHIESPAQDKFTLGNFFDLWGQEFAALQYPPQLDQPGGAGWKVYIDGKLQSGDFHSIVLQSHMLITLAYNSPNVQPDTTFAWNGL